MKRLKRRLQKTEEVLNSAVFCCNSMFYDILMIDFVFGRAYLKVNGMVEQVGTLHPSSELSNKSLDFCQFPFIEYEIFEVRNDDIYRIRRT